MPSSGETTEKWIFWILVLLTVVGAVKNWVAAKWGAVIYPMVAFADLLRKFPSDPNIRTS